MYSFRIHHLAIPLCLLLQACASNPPPPGAMSMEKSNLDTGQLEPTIGHKGDKLGAEVVGSEDLGDEQLIEIRVPIDPALVDQVHVTTPDGQTVRQSREARIVENYENNHVGISVRIPKSDNMGFRLKLVDHPDNDWPPVRPQ